MTKEITTPTKRGADLAEHLSPLLEEGVVVGGIGMCRMRGGCMMTRMACPGTTSAIANSTWGDLLIVTHQPMSAIRETVTHFERFHAFRLTKL